MAEDPTSLDNQPEENAEPAPIPSTEDIFTVGKEDTASSEVSYPFGSAQKRGTPTTPAAPPSDLPEVSQTRTQSNSTPPTSQSVYAPAAPQQPATSNPFPIQVVASPSTSTEERKGAVQKGLVLLIFFLFLAAGLVWLISTLLAPKPDLLLTRFEGLRRVENLRLVRHTYLEVIPFTKPNGNLQFLIEAPAHVYGKMNLSEMQYRQVDDNIIEVTLPPAELSEVHVDIDSIKELSVKGKKLSVLFGGGRKAFDKAYKEIIETLGRTKEAVRRNAVKNGILRDAENRGRTYVMNQANALGFRVRFVSPDDSSAFRALDRLPQLLNLDEFKNPLEAEKPEK